MRSAGSQCKAKAVLKRVIRSRWAKVRQTTFGEDAKTVYISSPVEEHQCRITELYEASTKERYHSRCPLCGHLQVLRLPEMDFETAPCRCNACGQPHGQDQWQSEPGQWIAENPGVARRGFWLNCFVSPFIRWEVVFAEFREAVHRKEDGDESLFRVVVATKLAENFVEHIERMSEPEVLLSGRENYSCEVPGQAKVIVAAIDTQVTWFEYLVVAGLPAVKSGVLRPAPPKAASRPMPKRCIT
jgi:phage terminase large subunit GpA-like protein